MGLSVKIKRIKNICRAHHMANRHHIKYIYYYNLIIYILKDTFKLRY
jgi:hypothetical protein